jgi:hypothetical protein
MNLETYNMSRRNVLSTGYSRSSLLLVLRHLKKEQAGKIGKKGESKMR